MKDIHKAVVLCGGEGLRLWPLSRTLSPKHLISLTDSSTFLQNTLARLNKIYPIEDILIVTNIDHKYEIIGQLYDTYKNNMPEIICEPSPKNTLPAVTYAVNYIQKKYKDSLITIFPADHSILDEVEFVRTIEKVNALSEENYIVTVGIKPEKPNTNFGYIQKKNKISTLKNIDAYEVESFSEKPNLKDARLYIERGYLWNSGIYGFKSSVFLESLKKYQLDLYQVFQNDENIDIDQIYRNIKPLSIDIGLAEKTNNLAVLKSTISWQDLGDWNSIHEFFKSSSDNALKGEMFTDDVENSLIWNYNGYSLISGVRDLIIVNMPDSLIVMNKNSSHKLKGYLKRMRRTKPNIIEQPNKTHRPWGHFAEINESAEYKVKKILVRPGHKLSLQLHKHRSEHWIVIKGTATVVNNDREFDLKCNESTFIPKNTKHRLINNQDTDLEIIEIQTGSYFGEDDIHRLDDEYDRIK
ncbi:MAG: mannose-1-phosphate guanylyltransferase/mannose-6-phosphate isomerase [Pseudomonadota bacterium]|nr:mannose-1-phosphate guanylyltransferase/mannose-6-phosphate isomerase [Pseudomonadota bacterium]